MNYTISDLFENKNVELELKGNIENDSFDHEFGTEKYDDYFQIEKAVYDENLYSQNERNKINKWIDDNWEKLEAYCYDNWEEDDYFDEPDPDDVYHREMQLLDKHGL